MTDSLCCDPAGAPLDCARDKLLAPAKSLRIRYLGYKKKTAMTDSLSCDPAGARTQDPRLKRALLYQLSYGIVC